MSVSVCLYWACVWCAWSFCLAGTPQRSYNFKEMETESQQRLLRCGVCSQVCVKPGGLTCPFISELFNLRQNMKHPWMSLLNYWGIIPVLTCLELHRSCLTLYPFTPPGGGLQVTNRDVTTCPERTTSCGTSGTIWQTGINIMMEMLFKGSFWATNPVWQKLSRDWNSWKITVPFISDVCYQGYLLSKCTRDSLYNVLVWRMMSEGLLRFSLLMLITLIVYRLPGARPSKL